MKHNIASSKVVKHFSKFFFIEKVIKWGIFPLMSHALFMVLIPAGLIADPRRVSDPG